MRILFVVAAFLLTPAFQAAAWGPEGHVAIAMVAEDRLTPKARVAARKILSGASLATAALFADEYRVAHPETNRWHYVDIPFDATGYDDARDCVVETTGDCVIRAFKRAKALVKDPQTPFYDSMTARTPSSTSCTSWGTCTSRAGCQLGCAAHITMPSRLICDENQVRCLTHFNADGVRAPWEATSASDHLPRSTSSSTGPPAR